MPLAMLPEPVLYTSIQAIRTWNQPHSMASGPARCTLWIHPHHYLPRFPMASLLISTIENP